MKNFEVGIQRLYYVLWAVMALWTIGYVVFWDEYMKIKLILIGIGVVLPGVVMFVVRWIYRGFRPKPS